MTVVIIPSQALREDELTILATNKPIKAVQSASTLLPLVNAFKAPIPQANIMRTATTFDTLFRLFFLFYFKVIL